MRITHAASEHRGVRAAGLLAFARSDVSRYDRIMRVVVCGVLLAIGCGDDGDSAARCASADYDCYLDHLVITENGEPLELTKVASIPMGGGGTFQIPTVWAAGDNGTLRRWTGVWSTPNLPTADGINYTALWGTSEGLELWLAGDSSYIARIYIENRTTQVSAVTGVTLTFRDAAQVSALESVAVAEAADGTGRFCTARNLDWTCIRDGEVAGALPALRGVWGLDTSNIWATGGAPAGPGFLQKGASNGILATSIPGATVGYDIWGNGIDIWIAGAALQRYTAGMLTDVPIGSTNMLRAVTGAGTDTLFVAEDNVGVHHWSNNAWTVKTLPFRVNAMWAHSATDAWAVGEGGGTAHWDGAAWTTFDSKTTQSLRTVWMAGATTPPIEGSAPPMFMGTAPGPFTFTGTSDEKTITLRWNDPAGCRPAFCFSACSPSGRCFAPARCTRLVRDGALSGITTLGVRYTSVPEGMSDENVALWVTPVSLDKADGDGVFAGGMLVPESLIGDALEIETTIKAPPMTSGGGTCSGGFQGSFSYCLGASSSCMCNGRSDDMCVTPSNFVNISGGAPFPSSCKAQGEVDCVNLDGELINPCCPGLSCVQGTTCAPDAPNVQGNGICWPTP